MASVKAGLKAARDALKDKDYKEALKQCKAVLSADKRNYNAYVFVGAAAEGLENPSQAEQAYKKAIEIEPSQPLAYQGLSRLYEKGGDADKPKLAEMYVTLAGLLESDAEKWLVTMNKAADLQSSLDQYTNAAESYLKIADKLYSQGTDDSKCASMDRLLKASDALEKRDAATGPDPQALADQQLNIVYTRIEGLAEELLSVENAKMNYGQVGQSAVGKRVARHRRHYWLANDKQAYQSARAAASDWTEQWEGTKGLEQLCELADEDAYEGTRADLLALYRVIEQRTSNNPLAQVGRGIAAEDVSVLEQGVQYYPQHVGGWVELVGLLVGPNPTRGESLASKALEYFGAMQERANVLHRSFTALRLLSARCRVSLGDSHYRSACAVFEEILAADPLNVAALQGLSEVQVLLKDYAGARESLEKAATIANEATNTELALGVSSNLGWVCYLQGEYPTAEKVYLQAIAKATGQASDTALALCHYRLGRLYWDMDGEYRTDKSKAQQHLLLAGKLNSQLAGPFTYLGHYYDIINKDTARAIKCYAKAVSLDPKASDAATRLSDLLLAKGDYAAAQEVHKQVCDAMGPRAPWAWFRSGLYHLRMGDGNNAVVSFQTMLRGDTKSPVGWECLGEAYAKLGKYSASLKAFGRALDLHTANGTDTLNCRFRMGRAQHLLGLRQEAMQTLSACLQVNRNFVPAIISLIDTLLEDARAMYHEGRLVRAASNIARALAILSESDPLPTLQCSWKLLGDLCAFTYYLPEEACVGIDLKHVTHLTSALGGHKAEISHVRSQLLGLATASYNKALTHQSHPAMQCDLAIAHYLHSLLLAGANSTQGAAQNIDLAQQAAKKAVTLDPSQSRSWGVLGVVSARAGQPRLAQHSFIKSLQLQPNSAETWTNLGVFYLLNGNIQLAHKAFAQAQAADPAQPRAWVGLALIAETIGDNVYRELLQHTADLDFTVEGYLGFATSTFKSYAGKREAVPSRQLLQAAYAAGKCTSREPANALAHNTYGLLLEAISLPAAAAVAFKEAHALLSQSSDSDDKLRARQVAGNAARALANSNHYAEAVQYYEIADVSTDHRLAAGLARAQFHLGRLAEAKQTYTNALQLAHQANDAQSTADIFVALAITAYGSGNATEARDLLFQCLQCMSDYPRCLFTLGSLGLVTNDPVLTASAMAEYEKVGPTRRTDPNVLSQAALLQACLWVLKGEPHKGVRELSKAVHSIGPGRPDVWGTLAAFILAREPFSSHLAASCLAASHVIATGKVGTCAESSRLLALQSASLLAAGSTSTTNLHSTTRAALRQAQKAVHSDPSQLGSWCAVAAAGLASSRLEPSSVAAQRLGCAVRVADYVRVQAGAEEQHLVEAQGQVHPVWLRMQARRIAEVRDWAGVALASGMVFAAANMNDQTGAAYQAQAQGLCQQMIGSQQPGAAQATWYRLLAQTLAVGPQAQQHAAHIVNAYKTGLQLNPSDSLAWQELAWLYSGLRLYTASELCLRQAVNVATDVRRGKMIPLMRLALSGLWAGNDPLAGEALAEALKCSSSCGPALLLQALRQQGDARQARRFQSAAQQATVAGTAANTMAGVLLARTHLAKGDTEAAAAAIGQSLPAAPLFASLLQDVQSALAQKAT